MLRQSSKSVFKPETRIVSDQCFTGFLKKLICFLLLPPASR